ncbi:creatininase family protein [Lichenibacterium ramalinae]|uniref:Creatininase family protein n=1 Tax=Lichenibacterium ramalinae TaxID=2316527 RepID=A0A4Q2R4C2_9HYPH|nr:creatininase family protein [Lichenibacterium ramalinae]RYB01385.1 creatininase family protein [Lichenibacterium ramalinae]
MAVPSADPVRWADLHREEFEARLAACPVVYLPLGLCEPHGHVAPFGLDTIKADHLCEEAARRFGGIVAPTMGYHVHETGYHAPWLHDVMEGANPRLGGLPPHVVLECFLYQLRAFANAGFTRVVAVSGHHGGNQADLRRVAREFARDVPMAFSVCSDPELVQDCYAGDHAGRYEISQLLFIRPDLVRMDRAGRAASQADGGRFAQNPDAVEATGDEGRAIIEASLTELGLRVARLRDAAPRRPGPFLPLAAMEPIWHRIVAERDSWLTLNL